MRLVLVAAVAKNGVIGSKNDLPWYLPEDLKHFKEVTMGKNVLMGRKTYESILNRIKKPLPGRTSIVITRNPDLEVPEGVKVFTDVGQALNALKDVEEIMVIGGAQIFEQTIDKADKLILTEVDKEYPGDVFFPKVDLNLWQKTSEEKYDGFSFVEYDRKQN